jgi:hypothetical protein
MRSSVSIFISNNFKKDGNSNNVLLDDIEETGTKNIIESSNNKEKVKTQRNRSEYFKNYYEDNKEKILNSNKENDKNIYSMH